MRKNFSIEHAIEAFIDGRSYDLHNLYDFKELKIEPGPKTVSLLFEVNARFRQSVSEGKRLQITFTGTDFFDLSPDFVSKMTSDLEEIGYKSPADMDIDWLVEEDKSSEMDHMFFRFGNGEFIRIHSSWATIKEDLS